MKKICWGKSGHGPHQPFHQCQPRSHGGWYRRFKKCKKKKVFKMCFRTQIMQKKHEKLSDFFSIFWSGRSKIAPLFYDVLEMDEGDYVDTFFSDTKEGWKWQFYINLSIFDTGQNCPTENFDGANLDMDPINLFISVNHVPMEVGIRRFKKCIK